MEVKKTVNFDFTMAALVAVGAGLIILPQVSMIGAKMAISIWLNSVVPSLLPFFIFSNYIRSFGVLDHLPYRGYAFLSGAFCGYPMGAKIVGGLIEEGRVSVEEGRRLLGLCMVTGPAFIMGTVGDFLGSTAGAFIILISHYGGALLNGLFFGAFSEKDHRKAFFGSDSKSLFSHYMQKKEGSFADSVIAGFEAMGMILSYLMFFMIGINILEHLGIFGLVGSEAAAAFIKGMLEMTVGAAMAGACNLTLQIKCIMVAVIVSFGGLSVACQSCFMVNRCGINLLEIVKIKAMHGLFAGILAIILTVFML